MTTEPDDPGSLARAQLPDAIPMVVPLKQEKETDLTTAGLGSVMPEVNDADAWSGGLRLLSRHEIDQIYQVNIVLSDTPFPKHTFILLRVDALACFVDRSRS